MSEQQQSEPEQPQRVIVRTDTGTGRPCVVVHEAGSALSLVEPLVRDLSNRGRVLLLESPVVSDANWELLTDSILELLQTASIRHCSFVSFGACGALVQAVALRSLRLARTIVLVDACTRAHPSQFSRLIDQIESRLPLGLPLRLSSNGFDAKPFLQRIRCPVLVVISPYATPHERAQAAVLEAGLPTAWMLSLSPGNVAPGNVAPDNAAPDNAAQDLSQVVAEFQDVPAKCPQKRAAASQPAAAQVVFHIAVKDDWESARATGEYWPRAEQGRFIHLCFQHQLQQVLQRYFSGRTDIVVLKVAQSTLADALRVEANQNGGETFPHLYRTLKVPEVLEVLALSAVNSTREGPLVATA